MTIFPTFVFFNLSIHAWIFFVRFLDSNVRRTHIWWKDILPEIDGVMSFPVLAVCARAFSYLNSFFNINISSSRSRRRWRRYIRNVLNDMKGKRDVLRWLSTTWNIWQNNNFRRKSQHTETRNQLRWKVQILARERFPFHWLVNQNKIKLNTKIVSHYQIAH